MALILIQPTIATWDGRGQNDRRQSESRQSESAGSGARQSADVRAVTAYGAARTLPVTITRLRELRQNVEVAGFGRASVSPSIAQAPRADSRSPSRTRHRTIVRSGSGVVSRLGVDAPDWAICAAQSGTVRVLTLPSAWVNCGCAVPAPYWRAIAMRNRSSGVMRWSRSAVLSSMSICTQWMRPVNSLSAVR